MISVIKLFAYIVATHWSIVSVYAILGYIGYILYKPKKLKTEKFKKVELCIVSKASNGLVKVLKQNISYHAKKFSDYKINVIIDEDSEAREEIKEYANRFKNVNVIIVPNNFKCRAIAKGRAIEYFIRTHVKSDYYYAFIDDDNLLMDDYFLREITYYHGDGYVACNGILYPRLGDSKLTFVADSLRYFDDLTVFRFGTGLFGKPLNGFHGELLLARGDVLKEITFNRKTVTEDFAFARELMKKGYKVWQSRTRISILSPHSVRDFIKQRNRWYRGISRDVWSASLPMKLFAGIRIIDWKIGIIGSWVFAPLWIFLPIPIYWSLFNLIGASYYYLAYIYGATRLKSIKDKIIYTLLIPVYSVLETIAPHYRPNHDGFIVIRK